MTESTVTLMDIIHTLREVVASGNVPADPNLRRILTHLRVVTTDGVDPERALQLLEEYVTAAYE